MNILFTLVVAFPLGWLLHRRSLAVVAYAAADSFVFTFQTLGVLLAWMAAEPGMGGAKAFGEFPTGWPVTYDEVEVFSYGIVNFVVLLAGIGLTVLGSWVRERRRRRPEAITVS